MKAWKWFAAGLVILGCLNGCSRKNEQTVVIYTSLDRPHSSPILEAFEKKSGIKVLAVYDVEASKTVGLVNRLIAEKNNPRADVFWNSEISRSIRLQRKEVTVPYVSASSVDIPATFKDPAGYWTGFAARARVFLYYKDQVSNPPSSVRDLTTAEWKGRFTIANPLFGTTATQVATWSQRWGVEATKKYLLDLKANGAIVSTGNATARDMVAAGEIPLCLTDTDDAYGAIVNNRPVKMVYPDQAEGQEGVLLIPNTVCLIANGPNSENGKKLIDFLLSREVEEMLAFSESAQIPLRDDVKRPSHVKSINELKIQQVDFSTLDKHVEEMAKFIQESFLK